MKKHRGRLRSAAAGKGKNSLRAIWRREISLPERVPLRGDLEADAAVIGAGMAGVLIARELGARGIKTVVLEAAALGSGQTGNTTAKITAQHGLIYQRLIGQFGEEKARQYARANQQAVERYRQLARDGVECDFVDCPAYLYSQSEALSLEREAAACRKLGLEASFTVTTALPFPVKGAVRMEGQAMFHPLKFLKCAAEGLTLYEHTPVLAVRGNQLITPLGRVTAEHIVFAAHYPFLNFPGFYFARMHQDRSYVAAVEHAAELDGIYYGVDPGGLSFRNAGPFLLVGGGGHRTGRNQEGGQYRMLERRAKELWPACRAVARWSAQDCMTLDGVPYIGPFSPTRPQWYVATGFQKWGMTSSMVAAGLIADAICQESNPLAPVFSPRRFDWTAARNLAREGGVAVRNLTRAVFVRPGLHLDQLTPGHGAVVSWQGKKVGAYKEENGDVHLVDPRCPHMGCQLTWNPEEKSWDCPCHGSRFDYDGNLIDNPAQTGL